MTGESAIKPEYTGYIKSLIESAASEEGLVNVYRGTGKVLMSSV